MDRTTIKFLGIQLGASFMILGASGLLLPELMRIASAYVAASSIIMGLALLMYLFKEQVTGVDA